MPISLEEADPTDMRCARFSTSKPRTRQPRAPTAAPTEAAATLRTSPRIQHTMPQQRVSKPASGRAHHPLSSTGPKPVQSEGRTGGGRHLQPPSASNTKLKHKCPFDGCPWRFATPYKLRRHIKSHTKETPYLCQECGRGFSVRYNLLMHIQTIHSQPQKYRCPIRGCKDAFHSQPRLNGHLRRVHKKDWKTLQTKTDDGVNSGGSAPNSRSSSTSSSDGSSPDDLSQYQCPQCKKECGTQPKLTTHLRSHAPTTGKPFKCNTLGCDKSFTSKDRLSKHLESHKNARRFCCPHTNCNRIFLQQSHLKTHLKIHTQGQFVCPVLDCGRRFSCEAGYNEHLSTHINYGHKCPVTSCYQSFPTLKRLELHCRAVHNTSELGTNSVLPGRLHPQEQFSSLSTQPHVPSSTTPHHRHVNSISAFPSSSFAPKPELLDYVPGIVESAHLPGLKVEDVEAVFSEKSDWSGEEIEKFLRSAVDLSEMEAKLLSNGGYESDSGYSTTPYDVSPITSSPSLQLGCYTPGGTFQNPISLSTIDHLGNLSPTTSFSFPGPLSHDPGTSSSDIISFFPGTDSYASPFFPEPSAVPQTFLPPYSCSTTGSTLGGGLSSFTNTTSNFSSEFTEFLASSCSFDTSGKPCLSDLSPLTSSTTLTSQFSSSRRSSDGQLASTLTSDGLLKPSEINRFQCRSVPNLGKLVVGSKSMGAEGVSSEELMQPDVTTIKVEANPSCYGYGGGTVAAPENNVSVSSGGTSRSALSTLDVPKVVVSSCTSMATGSSSRQQPNDKQHQGQAGNSGSSSKLQSLMNMCSQIPGLNQLLASSNNPTVFLMAISTALSTLTRPFQGGEGDTGENPGERSVVGPLLDKDGPFSVEQLQAIVSKLTPAQLEQLVKAKADTHLTAATSSAVARSNVPALPAKATERTVFASVLPTSRGPASSTCTLATSSVSVNGPLNTQHRYSMHNTSIASSKPLATGSKKPIAGPKPRIHRTNNPTLMKTSQKKRHAPWPRSMNQANLMAFREHILNKLKMSPEGQGGSHDDNGTYSPPMSVPASRMCDKVTVKCERNYLAANRCQSAPATMCSSRVDTTMPTLQSSASDSDISYIDGDNSAPLLSDLLLQTSSCADLFVIGFNPDTLLSSSTLSLPDELLEGMASSPGDYECPQAMEEDEELRQLLGEGEKSSMETKDTPARVTMASISDLLSEAQRTISGGSPPPCVSPLDRDASNSSLEAPALSYTDDRSSVVALAATRTNQHHGLIRAKATLQHMAFSSPPDYSFPAANSIHGSMTGLNSVDTNGISSVQLQIEENLDSTILKTHHDPLLAGNAASSTELFEF